MVNAKEMALAAAKALDSKKGRDIKVLEIDKITTLADYFVICSGGSNTQINALCDEVEKELDQRRAAHSPRGLSRRHLGAAGLRLRGDPCVQRGGPRVLRAGASVERRPRAGPHRRADAGRGKIKA